MTIKILGIDFFKGKVNQVFEQLKNHGGLLTVPAAPALVTIAQDQDYYDALLQSDLVIPDSGYMVLIWNMISKHRINKISGLEFINYFIDHIDAFGAVGMQFHDRNGSEKPAFAVRSRASGSGRVWLNSSFPSFRPLWSPF